MGDRPVEDRGRHILSFRRKNWAPYALACLTADHAGAAWAAPGSSPLIIFIIITLRTLPVPSVRLGTLIQKSGFLPDVIYRPFDNVPAGFASYLTKQKVLTIGCKKVLTIQCKKLFTEQCKKLLTIQCKNFLPNDVKKCLTFAAIPSGAI